LSNLIGDVVRKVFEKEVASLIAWLQRHKCPFLGFIVVVVIIVAYFKNPGLFHAIGHAISSNSAPLWSNLVLFLWLLALTYHIYSTRKSTDQREFFEDFRRGLENWEYYGGWRTEREDSRHILIVIDSDAGGIAKPCRLWTDYVFEFETKIAQANTSWIIRASDILNYVMLQCGPAELNPHFRVNGLWFKLQSVSLPVTLPLNTWFGVRITVTGTRVVVVVRVNDRETEIFNRPLLEPQIVAAQITQGGTTQSLNVTFSYPMGSVGFREWGNTECAHFRNVHVMRI
jgi:hypothetical protein